MSKLTRMVDDDYNKPRKTIQDDLNQQEGRRRSNLEGYLRIPYEECELLMEGIRIKYISNEGLFRIGGILIKNMYPEYIVLMNEYRKLTWCVDLRKNHIFMEDIEEETSINTTSSNTNTSNKPDKGDLIEKEQKENLFRLYKAGLLSLNED